jgi:hypothetical protein
MAFDETVASGGRGWRLQWLLALAIAVGVMVLPGTAAARTLPAPGLFKLESSNGYSVLVWGVPSWRGRPASVVMFVRGRAGFVTYFAPATVTETSIQASLGELGEIDVDFEPSGRATKEKSACGGRTVAFDSGFYEGTIDFTGEEGYTQVSAIRAKGDLQFVLDLICPSVIGPSGTGPRVPGAELRVGQRASRPGPSFGAHKNRPGARAFFEASVTERRDGIGIERSTGSEGRPAAFEYDHLLQTATVKPPPPFSGEATFRRNAAPANRWTGTLSVDFPGRSDVSFTAGHLHASLVRAEWQNSSQRERAKALPSIKRRR